MVPTTSTITSTYREWPIGYKAGDNTLSGVPHALGMGGASEPAPAPTSTLQALGGAEPTPWASRYGARHSLQRLRNLPVGLKLPEKVRIYARGQPQYSF